jgi:small subunit ribosomal protein S21
LEKHLQVFVRDDNLEQALRVLKKKMQREGVFREMKRRKAYEKPSERKTREKAEAIRRVRKAARKQAQRDGLIPMPKRREDVRRSVARPDLLRAWYDRSIPGARPGYVDHILNGDKPALARPAARVRVSRAVSR